MKVVQPLSPWRTFFYGLTMGPIYLLELQKAFQGPAWLICILPLILLVIASYLSLCLVFPPMWISLAYVVFWLSYLALIQLLHWLAPKDYELPKSQGNRLSIVRSIIALSYITTLFQASGTLVLILLYWAFAAYVTVQIVPSLNVSLSWLFGGFALSVLYGFRDRRFLDQDLPTHFLAFFMMHVLALGFGLCELALINYPIDRLSPLHFPVWQSSILNLYIVFFVGQLFISYFFLSKVPSRGLIKNSLVFGLFLPFIALHFVQLSAHSSALYLTYASIRESQGNLQEAREMYAHAIPHISGEAFNAALLHRQGVLHGMEGEREEAVEIFKKVVADYTADVKEYEKASEYVKSYQEFLKKGEEPESEVLKLRYQTFEQAASCFPNSLGMILHYYEQEPISTRELSYQIKEGFHDGTFIWKAQTFLETTDYRLMTSYWQDLDQIISFLKRKIPVLIYIPGHVFSVYGYDESLKILLSYDTARANRWDDKPYKLFFQEWMESAFLMSVVIHKDKVAEFEKENPEYVQRGKEYQVLQKFDLSNYYVQKFRYLRDYDASKDYEGSGVGPVLLGSRHQDALLFEKMEAPVEELSEDVVKNPWSTNWDVFERVSAWHLLKGEPAKALDLIEQYQRNLTEEGTSAHYALGLRKLSVYKALGEEKKVQDLSTQLMGEAEKEEWDSSYWGHAMLAQRYLEADDLEKFEELIEPILHHIHPAASIDDPAFRKLLLLISKFQCANPDSFTSEKQFEIELALISHGVPQVCKQTN